VYFGFYTYNRLGVEAKRWHRHERRVELKDLPAHHFTNKGGVLVKKEFVGFNKYFTDGENQMEWLRQAYPAIYSEEQK
jgi:hypothetical protein